MEEMEEVPPQAEERMEEEVGKLHFGPRMLMVGLHPQNLYFYYDFKYVCV